MQSKSTNVLNYSEIEANRYKESLQFINPRYFVLLIKGTLPLGQINIRAIHISNENRETAFIDPCLIENDDPRANLHAKAIAELLSCGQHPSGRSRYYIFLEKDGVELAGSELLIR
jgi:hypothetical protein